MFIDTDLNNDMYKAKPEPKEKKPYKPSNKVIFKGLNNNEKRKSKKK
jgi:hypothetical protein